MSDLKPQESMLIGRWITSAGRVEADEACKRIERLTGGELEFVGSDPDGAGWVRLFRDPADARYWELTYPNGNMHGGGPPTLRCLSDEEVANRYRSEMAGPSPPPILKMLAGFVLAPTAAAIGYAAIHPLAGTNVPWPEAIFWTAGLYTLIAIPIGFVFGYPTFTVLSGRLKPTITNFALVGSAIVAVPFSIIGLLSLMVVRYQVSGPDGPAWGPALATAEGWLNLLWFTGEIAAFGVIGGAVFWMIVEAPGRKWRR